jgi:hypothetical protein
MTDTRFTLSLIDTSGIQSYIFGSNRLRENIGASQRVHAATTSAVQQVIQEALNEQHDLSNLSSELPLESTPERQCEVIYTGGGNVLLLCRSTTIAKKIVHDLSLHLHIHAPGLQFIAAHLEFDWQNEPLGDQGDTPGVLSRLSARLAHAHQHRPPAAPLYGLGVTLDCPSTGLPAIAREPDPPPNTPARMVSASTLGKLHARAAADTRLKTLLGEDALDNYAIPTELDSLGRSRDEQSYIAVVHIDGNGMGTRFRQAGQASPTNRATIHAVRSLSQQINETASKALKQTIEALLACLVVEAPPEHPWSSDRNSLLHSLAHDRASKRPYLPFRPLVFGGDDVTFVCDGRLGLALAAHFLDAFEQTTAELPGGRAHACAGVAIVKSHFPFARAYALAEDLCDNAKKALRAANLTRSALDWHIAASGRTDNIKAIRKRAYQTTTGAALTARPVLFAPDDQTPPEWKSGTWPQVQQTVATLNYAQDWRERRNKVLALRDVLRQGSAAVAQFQSRYQIETLPHTNPAMLFDAIEAMGFLLPLAPPKIALETDHG